MKTTLIVFSFFLMGLVSNSLLASENLNNSAKQQSYDQAQALLDSGEVTAATQLIKPLVENDATFGDGAMTLFQAYYLNGQFDKALSYGLAVQSEPQVEFSGRKKSWFRHSLIGGLIYQGRLSEAEALIVDLYPVILTLKDRPVEPLNLRMGVPIHTVIAYIHILRATDRGITADKIAAHFEGFSAKAFFELEEHALSAPQSWMLASILAADDENHLQVIQLLHQAFDKGFQAGWPFNYRYHPVYWSLRNHEGFEALLSKIDARM